MGESIELIKSSYKSVEFAIECAAALTKAYFMVKRSLEDLDADSLVTKTINTGLTASGQISAAGPPTATAKFFISETDLNAISPGNYVWCVKCISAGHAYRPPDGWGKLTVSPAGIVYSS